VAAEVGAVRAVPVEVGDGDRRSSEARNVPWSGACAAREGLGRRRLLLAAHAEAIGVTWKLCHLFRTNELNHSLKKMTIHISCSFLL